MGLMGRLEAGQVAIRAGNTRRVEMSTRMMAMVNSNPMLAVPG
jgi:hypothetical protein